MDEKRKNMIAEFNRLKKLEASASMLRKNHAKRVGRRVSSTSFAKSFGFQTYQVEFSKKEDINNIEAILGNNYPDFLEKGDKSVIYLNSNKKSSARRRYAITYQIVNFILRSKGKYESFINTVNTFDLNNSNETNCPIGYITRAILLPLNEVYKLYKELFSKLSKKNSNDVFLEERIADTIAKKYDVPIQIAKRRIKDIKICEKLTRLNDITADANKMINDIEKEAGVDYKNERELPSKKRSLIRRLGLNGYEGKYLKKKSD